MFLATVKVEDFDRFWGTFSTKGADKRKEHGSRGSHVFRDPNDETRVWVLFDWDEEGFQDFLSDPEVPAIVQEAGHLGRPQVAALGGEHSPSPDGGPDPATPPCPGERARRPPPHAPRGRGPSRPRPPGDSSREECVPWQHRQRTGGPSRSG